jgi:two-component system OmpR family sensor kinase
MRRFVADASHELRTPLTSIRGFAELYRMGAANEFEDLPRLMHRIEEEAARMGVLVEDLLLLARLDQQRPLAADPVDLLAVTSDVVHDAQVVAAKRPISLTADAEVPPVVRGDPQRLQQVVTNLVSNALTHTPAGTPIDVRVSIEGHSAVVTVADRGPGIDATTAARVFERFYRADESRSRTGGGSGLGLSIVAGLVAAHGGTVSVDQRPGGGAVFAVTIPLFVDVDPPTALPGSSSAEDVRAPAAGDRQRPRGRTSAARSPS